MELEFPQCDVIGRSQNKRRDDRAERDHYAEHHTALCWSCVCASVRACVCACVRVCVCVIYVFVGL